MSQRLKLLKLTCMAICMMVFMTGCVYNMRDQPRHEPYEKSEFFEDNMADRAPVDNTVAVGHLKTDKHLYQAQGPDGKPVTEFPFEITEERLERGHQQFDIFCAPCHGLRGDGQGMIVQRGMKQPRSFLDESLQQASPSHFFNIMTNGMGAMYSYSSRIKAEDRWAIAAYIRALQLSQNATLDDIDDPEIKQNLEEMEEVGK